MNYKMTDEPTQQQPEQTPAQMSGLELLTRKYEALVQARQARQTTAAPESDAAIFDARVGYQDNYQGTRQDQKRLGKGPRPKSEIADTGKLHAEMAAIKLSLARLAKRDGKLKIKFKKTLGKERTFEITDYLKENVYRGLGKTDKADKIVIDAADRRGQSIRYLIDGMTEVTAEQYNTVVKGKTMMEGLLVNNVAFRKRMHHELIESLRTGYHGTADLTVAEAECDKLQGAMNEFEEQLAKYETEVKAARESGNLESVMRLTTEMEGVLALQETVMDQNLEAQNVSADVRREIMDRAEGVQSAKGAIAASKVNYLQINALIDSYNELEIKYRYAKDRLMAIFREQGDIAAAGMEGLKFNSTLIELADVSKRLMDADVELIMRLSDDTFKLMQRPLYDPAEINPVKARLETYMTDLNNRKKEWAANVTSISEQPRGAAFVEHQ